MFSSDELICKYCGSDNICFHKKTQICDCEDCGKSFSIEELHKFEAQKIFLSYGHDKNIPLVEAIKDKLEARGHLPWIDKSEIKVGDEWRISITNGIQESDDFLAFISQYSTRVPGVCLNEIQIALGTRNCRIQTIKVEDKAVVPQSIRKIQWLDLSDWEMFYNQGGEVWSKWLNSKGEIICGIIESPENQKLSGEILDLEKKLMPGQLNSLKLSLLLKSMTVERQWLINEIESWYKKNNNSNVFFLVGNPGSGKSIVSAYLSNFLVDCCAVCFFEYDNADTHNLLLFLKNLAFQLACSITDYRAQLIKILDGYIFDGKSLKTIFSEILSYPLNNLIDGDRQKSIIVLDALDEIPPEQSKGIYSFINQCVSELPKWIRWIITSRPEMEVLKSMARFEPFVLEMNKKEIMHDIEIYIKKIIPDVDSETLRLMLQKSEGSFMYVRELLSSLDLECDLNKQIRNMPKGMIAIYINNFRRIFDQENCCFDGLYREVLSVITVTFEPISINYLMDLLSIDERKVEEVLDKLSSYVLCEKQKNSRVLLLKHKSIKDWITSVGAAEFRIYERDAHMLLCEKMRTEGRKFNEYEMKYAYDHFVAAGLWKSISEKEGKRIINMMISASKHYADIENEKKALLLLKQNYELDYEFALKYLNYAIRCDEDIDIQRVADQILRHLDQISDEIKRFYAVIEVATAFFYIGKDKESIEILEIEYDKHNRIFWQNEDVVAEYNHALGLPAHDLDMNRKVYDVNKKAAEINRKQKENYKQSISKVNQFDAAMGMGRLEEAENLALEVYKLNDQEYYVHVADILDICYGNVLQEQNRIMEAFMYYESGLKLAKNRHEWDYIYGSIWRELAIARFGDHSCLEALLQCRNMAKSGKYEYLASLADCFYLIALNIMDKTMSFQEEVWDELMQYNVPGHVVQGAIAMENLGEQKLSRKEIFEYILQCEGIKGYPEMILDWYNNIEEKDQEVDEWILQYVKPVVQKQKEIEDTLMDGIDNVPLVHDYSCAGCEAKCCYDGVYLSEDDEKRIIHLVTTYPDEFADLPSDFIVEGNWPGLEDEKKTAVVEHEYKCSDYPTHFEKTRCIFANNEGYCRLQRVATDHQLHPWNAKPRACWSFPIGGIRQGKILAPPKSMAEDPNNMGPEYPGYVSCLECAKHYPDGKPWKYKYLREIEYYKVLEKYRLIDDAKN